MTMFQVEIIECENGYIVGPGFYSEPPGRFTTASKRWVAANASELAKLIEQLAVRSTEAREAIKQMGDV